MAAPLRHQLHGHQPSASKRPASPDETQPRRPKQRRAAKACVACHRRKVRCDVVQSHPCSNCKLDDVEVSQDTTGHHHHPNMKLRLHLICYSMDTDRLLLVR